MTSRTGLSRGWGALSGLLAAALAMGIAQLIAGLSVPAASPVIDVGSVAINHTPLPVKVWATSTFGTNDKTVLLTGVFVVVFLYAMLVGVLAARRLALGFAGLALFACLGIAAAVTRHGASPGYAVPTVIGALAGAYALYRLIGAAQLMTSATALERAPRDSGQVRAPRDLRAPGALPPIVFQEPSTWADDQDEPDQPGASDQTGVSDRSDPDDAGELRAPDLPRGEGGPGGAGRRPGTGPGVGETGRRPGAGSGVGEPGRRPGAGSGVGEPGRRPGEVVRGPREGSRGPGRTSPVPPRAGGAWRGSASPVPSASADRRSFLLTAGVTVAAAAIGEVAGRSLATRKNVSAAQAAVKFPRAAVKAPPLPAGVNLPVPGISPFITPNGQFYRVDTALIVPQVDPTGWQLRIHGMVAREITMSFDQLLHRPLIEDYITLTCVSNPVGGPYVGNAKWLGASLSSLIRAAGPLRGAEQLFCTSVDGFTSGVPLATVLDAGRDSLVAVAMNGAALPTEHGFPARLVVPGLYGYVSACKWVVDIEVTTWAGAAAYWYQNGWAQQAPIKTESRIDVPASGSSVKAGKVSVAGVAWAQHKGIEAVEVRIDNGPWHEATLAAVPDLDTWRQWVWEWDATDVGAHTIEARATDKTGYTQTSLQAPEAPNGASGYPVAQITVSA
jgi:DMSO/TMAO reductase YedYZ molybdopterin-dependent catalytic subunit